MGKTMGTALLLRCLARDVVALCRYKPRATSDPTFVALVPQAEEVDEGGRQVQPPGFHVVYLPFLDDFRQLPENSFLQESDPTAVQAAKAVIAKLRLKQFVPVENPDLQTLYRLIEAHGLRRDTLVKPEDETLPDYERMSRKLGDKSKEFIDSVYHEGYDPDVPIKKKASPTPKAPKLKVEAADIDMKAQVNAGSVGKLSVDVLKSWLKEQGLGGLSKMKEADLVEQVNHQF